MSYLVYIAKPLTKGVQGCNCLRRWSQQKNGIAEFLTIVTVPVTVTVVILLNRSHTSRHADPAFFRFQLNHITSQRSLLGFIEMPLLGH